MVAQLDRRAARQQVSRSQVVRQAVAAYLAADLEDDIAESYRQGYEDIPAGTPDVWGDIEAFHGELAQRRQPDQGRN